MDRNDELEIEIESLKNKLYDSEEKYKELYEAASDAWDSLNKVV